MESGHDACPLGLFYCLVRGLHLFRQLLSGIYGRLAAWVEIRDFLLDDFCGLIGALLLSLADACHAIGVDAERPKLDVWSVRKNLRALIAIDPACARDDGERQHDGEGDASVLPIAIEESILTI